MNKHDFSITVIDDDETVHYIIRTLVKRENPAAKVNSFTNPIEFLTAYTDDFSSDGILLDINMPKMDGWQLLERLKKIPFSIPIYMFSSSADTRDVDRITKYDIVKGYIVKPLTSEKLRTLLSHIAGVSV
jgi:CheY-like chemotaxis protein